MSNAYTPARLRLWSMPRYYHGATWEGHYVAPVGRSRDSDSLELSNWQVQLEELGGEDGEAVTVVRENHFLCGWVEWVAIASDAAKQLQVADRLAERLEVYPCLNEERWSALQLELGELELEEGEDD